MRKLAAVCLVLLLAGAWWSRRSRPSRHPGPDLRDAPASTDWKDLAQLHARQDGGDTCLWCHADRELRAREASRDPSRWLASAGPAGAGDAWGVTSTVCLSCHDGSLAGAARDYAPESSWGQTGLPSASHPIGMPYAAAAARKPNEYRSPFDTGVTLEDGRVGCGSCHVGHRGDREPAGPAGIAKGMCQNCHRY